MPVYAVPARKKDSLPLQPVRAPPKPGGSSGGARGPAPTDRIPDPPTSAQQAAAAAAVVQMRPKKKLLTEGPVYAALLTRKSRQSTSFSMAEVEGDM
eukprot:m.189599 g.189599  ORF g.189599 m.189599 type:complete len:97 (+) comp17551_c0_seq1:659-949(+)